MLMDRTQSAAIIAIGMTIMMVAVQAAATNMGGATWLDASCLLQASLQQPWVPLAGMQQPHTATPWFQTKQVRRENSPNGFDDPNTGANTLLIADNDDDYNRTEWNLDTSGMEEGVVSDPQPGISNTCYLGNFIPEFILIGVVKAATTSFAADIRQSPGILFPSNCKHESDGDFCNNNTGKEGHFFDLLSSGGMLKMKSYYPKCSHDMRKVAVDMSPRYMIDHAVPGRIHKWYKPNTKLLKFIIVLRDPVARFHSDYYYSKVKHWCTMFKNTTFAQIVTSLVAGKAWDSLVGGHHHCTDRLEGSLYPAALRRWFGLFEPRQFIVVPYMYVTKPYERGSHSIVEHVWNMLGVEHGVPRQVSHFNGNEHPTLSNDLDQDLYERFKSLIWLDNGPLQVANTFVEHPGAMLFGYTAEITNPAAISNWLQENW